MAKEFYVQIEARFTLPIRVIAENEEDAVELAEDYAEDGGLFEYTPDSGSSLGAEDDILDHGYLEEIEVKSVLANTCFSRTDWQNSGEITIKRYEDE